MNGYEHIPESAIGFVLDWPASINRAVGGGVRKAIDLNQQKQTYKQASFYAVRAQCGPAQAPRFAEDAQVGVVLGLHPPDDSRKRDIDNGIKWILDAIEYSGVISNDHQVRSLLVNWFDPTEHGAVTVMVEPMDSGPNGAWEVHALASKFLLYAARI
jgi:Holliday junction resolvase RusA-like endonuclease